MSLADYLAKNYLTADSEKKSKKRKRKTKEAGLTIDDDDTLGWKDKAEDDDDDAPVIGDSLSRALSLVVAYRPCSGWSRPEKIHQIVKRHQHCPLDFGGRCSTFARPAAGCRCRRCRRNPCQDRRRTHQGSRRRG